VEVVQGGVVWSLSGCFTPPCLPNECGIIIKEMKKILAIIAVVPIACWVFSYMLNPSPDKISKAGELIAQAATPWWVPVVQFFAPLGIIGAIIIIGVLIFASRQS
jgi:hypothetical protein